MLISSFVNHRNAVKHLFTPGPASLLEENILGLRPCFGRNDTDYRSVEDHVLKLILNISGQKQIVALQGSATLALEIACNNFLNGNVLLVQSGYYSDRLRLLAELAANSGHAISKVDIINWDELAAVSGAYDWVLSCSTETSMGLRIEMSRLRRLADQTGARLLLDATASIGLEAGHEVGDVVCFSSCKGLLGFSGASFVCYNSDPQIEVNSFCLSLDTYLERRVTPPLHAICSLAEVLPIHDDFRSAIVENKSRFLMQFRTEVYFDDLSLQPLLCTRTRSPVHAVDPRAVTYVPRSPISGSVVCHLGEVHLKQRAEGRIIDMLEVVEAPSQGF